MNTDENVLTMYQGWKKVLDLHMKGVSHEMFHLLFFNIVTPQLHKLFSKHRCSAGMPN